MKRLVFFLIPLLLLCSCAQWWQVRPYPDFISAEIRAGDQLRIETSDGIEHKLLVVKVSNDRITGEGRVILFSDILTLEKHSKTSPFNACNPSRNRGRIHLFGFVFICHFRQTYTATYSIRPLIRSAPYSLVEPDKQVLDFDPRGQQIDVLEEGSTVILETLFPSG
jgi:hypothetical protein